ncbi:MAG: aspartyl/asparaginyl beta-hydroxylase domain-containing protein [Sphingomonadales bacterium]|nr:aspartyl/asparaginyl beta-hydroxylase domain-containing protein [Sphingomonadales bacterium]
MSALLANDDPLLLHDRLRLPLAFDPARLAADLDAMPEEAWIPHFVQQNYEGDWSVLPLRCKQGATHPVMMAFADPSATAFEVTPWLAHGPYLAEVLAAFRSPLQTARLMKLTPGSTIKPHHDNDLSIGHGSVRLHIPVRTNPQVDFRLNQRRVDMAPGSCWFLRLADVHSIVNDGDTDRVHLVIDATVDAWLLDLLRSGQAE